MLLDAVCREQVRLSNGVRTVLPAGYRDWCVMMGHFPAPAAGVRELLPTTKLKPVALAPGVGVLTVYAAEYRRPLDMPPYKEAALLIPVLYEPKVSLLGASLLLPTRSQGFGLFVVAMPVTTGMALDFGVEIWGYPRFLADIVFTETEQTRSCRVETDGSHLLALDVKKLPTRARKRTYTTYSVKDGSLVRATMESEEDSGIGWLGTASCTLGAHPLAHTLHELKIATWAVQSLYAPHALGLLWGPDRTLPL